MSDSPPFSDFAIAESPFVLPDERESKSGHTDIESEQHGNKRVRVQSQALGDEQSFDDDDMPSPAPHAGRTGSNNSNDSQNYVADGTVSEEERKEEHDVASDGSYGENERLEPSPHAGSKRRRPPPLHNPPYQPAATSSYSPPPELERAPEQAEDMDHSQPSYTQMSNEVSNEADSSHHAPPQSQPAHHFFAPPQSQVAPAESIDLTDADEDEVLPTPILPLSLSQSHQQSQSQPVQPISPFTYPSPFGHSSSPSHVPFHAPQGSFSMAAGTSTQPTFSPSASSPPFPLQQSQPAQRQQPPPPSQPSHYAAPHARPPRSQSEHSAPAVAQVPYSMVSSPPEDDGDVVDLTDEADIEADMRRMRVPLPSTTPPPPPRPLSHYNPPSSLNPSGSRSAAVADTGMKEEISLLDDETEERFGSMLAFIRPTQALPNMKLNSPVNIYQQAVPGDPYRMRATTDSEEDIGLLNIEASHALCPLLAQRRINIDSRVVKIDAVSALVIVRVNVYGDAAHKAEINVKIHQYCPLHYFVGVAEKYIAGFVSQQQQPVSNSQAFKPELMQQVTPYISQAFSGPSISELEQHLDGVFSEEDQRKGYDIDTSQLRMPHVIATELHEYQKQGLVWMQGRERLKAEWRKKKPDKDAGGRPKRDPFTGQVVEDDEEVEQFLIWERRTKNGRVRYWNRAKNKYQASEPVFAKGGILADDMGLGKTLQMISLIASDLCDDEEGAEGEEKEEKGVKDEVDLLGDDDMGDDDWLSKLDDFDDERKSATPPPSSSTRRRNVGPTLIVCPLSVITNWQEQIERHVKRMHRWSVYTYHGGQRVREVELLEQYDVVITTYNIVSSEWVDDEAKEKEEEEKDDSGNLGPLYGQEAGRRKKSKEEKEAERDHFPEDNPNSEAARSSPLFAMHWHRIILDEAHNIRERRTRQSRACQALLGTCRWAVTGTPFQNRLDDGYALMHFLRIEPFTSHRWWNKLILEPIKRRDGRGIERLQQVMGSICLRRKKGDSLNGKKILHLPDKHSRYLEVELTKEEKALYGVLEASATKRFVFLLNEDEALKQYAFVMEMLLRLRQCCDHISLVPERYYRNGFGLSDSQMDETRRLLDLMNSEASASDKCKLCRQELGEDEWGCVPCCVSVFHNDCLNKHFADATALHALSQSQPQSSIKQLTGAGKAACPTCQRTVKREQVVTTAMRMIVDAEDQRQESSELFASPASHLSSKMAVLLQELQSAISVGDKAVVFSQWTTFLDLLAPALTNCGIVFTRLDGKMSNQQRAAALTSFANNPSVSVFLISLKAGGVGLNLTAANRVYLMDIWWNPAAEDQAVDRVHRLGQTKPVDVVRMIVRGGVEERVMKLQEKKREMTKNAMTRTNMTREETQAERLSDLRALFGVSADGKAQRK